MHILILGAGYAGLRVAIELGKHLAEKEDDLATITLVEQHSYHQHIVLLHQVATEATPEHEAVIPLDKVLHGRPLDWREARVSSINPEQQQVALEDGSVLSYDRLVLAVGSQTDDFGIPGVSKHTLPLRSFPEAQRLRDHITACFHEAATTDDPATRRMLLTTAIVGGGTTGCQLAGELAAWADTLAAEAGVLREDVRIALIERAPRLLGMLAPRVGHEAVSTLDQRLVSVYLNTPVERVEEQTLFVGGNRKLRAGTIAWAAGIRAPDVVAQSGFPTDSRGRVCVDRFLRVEGCSNVFALGDCARVPDTIGGTVPSTAGYATRQGDYLAGALIAELEGHPPPPYEPLPLGTIVSLGPDRAVGDIVGLPIKGRAAALLKQGVEKWYLKTLE